MKKIKWIGAVTITVAFVMGLIVASLFSARSVGNVGYTVVKSIGSDSVRLHWSEVENADGYYIYLKSANDKEYSKTATVEDCTSTTYTLKKLSSSTDYSVYVNAYRQGKAEVYESEEHREEAFKTIPAKMSIKVRAEDKESVDAYWKSQQRIDGYELQLTEGDDFTDCETFTIERVDKLHRKFTKLEPEKMYSARIRAYYNSDGKRVFGEWSEPSGDTVFRLIDLSHLDPDKPMVALTYDDGPGYNKSSDKILDTLEKYGVRATFFMVGKNAADHPKNVKRKIALGCEIGNHTYNHNHYGKNVTASDIKKASEAIYKAGGVYPTCFRSPGGITTKTIKSECVAENMPLYYWSLDTEDWKSRDADAVYKAVIKHVKDGDIILMHEIYDSTAEATERIIPELIKRGYQLVTCEELVAVKSGKPARAGVQYLNATTKMK